MTIDLDEQEIACRRILAETTGDGDIIDHFNRTYATNMLALIVRVRELQTGLSKACDRLRSLNPNVDSIWPQYMRELTALIFKGVTP